MMIIPDKKIYREVCWYLHERGAVGETILHLCMLNATAIHADLAKRLLRFYPKLINDIYISDEYYGMHKTEILIKKNFKINFMIKRSWQSSFNFFIYFLISKNKFFL